MTKYLITGSSGFVGKNFLEYLNDNTVNTSVLGIDIAEPAYSPDTVSYTHLRAHET